MSNNYYILLTFDVEDWFQVENFKQHIPFSSWPNYELRVEKNTHHILDILDSQRSAISSQSAVSANPTNSTQSLRRRRTEFHHFHLESDEEKKSNQSSKSCLTAVSPKATFFVLGWIAKRLPDLVREIHARGHEVASHGYYHNLCNQQSPDALKRDLSDSRQLLEDIIGAPVYGYRAPSFSISNDILNTIADAGYLYDSSFNSFGMHGRYGHVKLSQNGKKGIALPISAIRNPQSAILFELPISNIKLGSSILPWGGGAYFRLIPLPLFKMGVRSILKKEGAYLFYMHPWEVDPEQPRIKKARPSYRARHYVNLDKTYAKLLRLIRSYQHCRFLTCSQYIKEMER